MADWANLPTDILYLIAQRMEFMEDYISLRFTCKPWQLSTSILLNKKPTLPPRFPRVMLTESAEGNEKKRRFFSQSTSKTYEIELPEATNRKCYGAYYGWLLTVGYDLQINLLHPFTRRQVSVPPLLAFKDQYEYDETFKVDEVVDMFVRKVVMSANPENNDADNNNIKQDCVVFAIYGELRVLAFSRPGDEVWTNVPAPSRCFDDIVCYKGKFYAVDCHGTVFVCDIDNKNGPKGTRISPTPLGIHDMDQKYIAESSGDLLLVIRFRQGQIFDPEEYWDDRRYHTFGFSVYRLDSCQGTDYPYKLTFVDSLGDRALFLGYNASVSMPSSGCVRANCIYFSDDSTMLYRFEPSGGGLDTGIFDMERGTVESHYASKFRSLLTPPLWFI